VHVGRGAEEDVMPVVGEADGGEDGLRRGLRDGSEDGIVESTVEERALVVIRDISMSTG
jgi:hypothetical protein